MLIEQSGKQTPELINAYIGMASASAGFGQDSVEYANLAFVAGTGLLNESQSPIGEKYLQQALIDRRLA